VRLDKIKRPAGTFEFDMLQVERGAQGVWLWYPVGSSWRAPHDHGTMPFDALLLVSPESSVTWWVDDPADKRIEIDVCLQPLETPTGWSFVDLELDPVRHEATGLVEVQDRDEFEHAVGRGWMSSADAEFALTHASAIENALISRLEPWGDEGWARLQNLKTLA